MAEAKPLFSAFDFVSQPVIIAKKQLISYMNPAAMELIRKDLGGKPVSMLFPPYILNTQADSFAASAVIEGVSCAVRVTSAEGCRVYILDTAEPGCSERFMLNMQSRLNDIRAALTVLRGLTRVIGNETLNGVYAALSRSFYSIERSVQNASILRGLADGSLPFRPEALDVSELTHRLIENVCGVYREQVPDIRLHAEEHIRINADKLLLERMLLNLFSNSLKHCGQNGRISVSMIRSDSYLTIGIDDDGDGMSADELAAVFRKYRSVTDTAGKIEGDGMGLAIVRGIAEKHGGTVIVESRGKGKGSSVRVMLSYATRVSENFRASASGYAENECQRILTQLSTCLPDECYSGENDPMNH